ncbi:DUF2850 domain-containing protein [Vibrio gazogenes]|uniref:DUF2850 domain-containing protein n=1 Tax=Vibrio gazogenes DSM 21264 = NBRC 103151 TaxID=1123492 RepID=A0A1M4SSZ2_VIBGA|nr:DUF2850 domain-containing protein [Vibrio gazogenes]USP15940.1 DUF2850 domain-containing protein [Vibrio gazogenes]SHE35306.1 Protein of unknown function [Vibrio gazogenes DSM 21264] [Vibrio gazogenes DSM 21264 = NBRC 103151]
MKSLLAVLGLLLIGCSAVLIYMSYQDYTSPKKVYGVWLETQVMHDRREVITFNKRGVYRNSHLITTKFDFNGKQVQFKSGGQEHIYQISGTASSPQLKRIEPSQPVQVLIKKGYEHTLAKPDNAWHRVNNTRSSFAEGFTNGD